MTDTPMTPEELAKVTRDARAWVERPSFSKKGWIDALCLALLQERARAEALAAENEKLRADARWLVRRTIRACKEAEGYLPDDPFTPWSIDVTALVQEAADRLADKEGT
jgi:hypothetical protein